MKSTFAIALCTLVGVVSAPRNSAAQTKKVDGFEGYRFGMTLEQALKIRPSAKQTKCEYTGVAACLEYGTTVSAFPATVAVQFERANPLLLTQILITIHSMDDPIDHTCRDVTKELLKLMVPKYGDKPLVEDHKVTWASSEGGSVSLTSLCIGPEKGINVISYMPSSVP
jgi:hypothetical protein